MLSRIDGHTPWAVLREIGGLSPEEADLALESWVRNGLVLLDPGAREVVPTPDLLAGLSEKPRRAARDPRAGIDPSLDLDLDFQREIIAFEVRLAEATYHEILGVGLGTEPRQIKRAYFQLSKRFHPDRYFRRNLGEHALRLDRIFKHVALAYELLSDPTTRAELERGMESAPTAPEATAVGADRGTETGRRESIASGPASRSVYHKPTRMENLQRLRNRFRMPAKLLAERRFRAGQFHQAARVAAHEKRWLEAAGSARLAIAFDPWNPEYKQHFASLQADVHAARATALLQEADGANAKGDALKLLEEAIHYRPADAALQARAAQLALDTDDLERAREFAASACELDPDTVGHHLLLCRAQRRAGDLAAARAALAVAAKLSPQDPDVMSEQKLSRRAR